MKNRIWVFVVAFITIAIFNINKLSAQAFPINPSVYSDNINVPKIDGVIAKGVYRLDLHVRVPDGKPIDKSWSIGVRVTSPIELGETKIPSEKIGIRFNKVMGNGGISLSDVGVNNGTIYKLNHNTPIFLIDRTSTVLENNKNYEFHFDIIVEGGNYLTTLIPWTAYPFGLTFYITVGAQTTIIERGIDFRVEKIVGDNTIPEFGFEVNANATLDFTTPEHYTRQVENDLSNSWVKVTSKNSGYVVKVKTNNPNFELIRNDSGVSGDATIPVNVVNVEMQSAGSGASQGAKPLLSTDVQTLFIGTKNKNAQKLPVRYFIRKTEAEKLATKTSGEYKAILTYTLEPN